MLTGSCLCGAIAYQVDSDIGPIVHCHCQTCRKAHGAAFSSVSPVPRAQFRWTRGQQGLKSYESSPGKLRHFCPECGSQIVAERVALDVILLRLGCVDTPITATPKCHIWRSDAATWYDPQLILPERPMGV
jgi:hypothetical protein